jgi:pimeloyl-[acyl-carrier protein] methyl ester esterase
MKHLVFLSGWGFDARVWQPVADRLADEVEISFDGDIPAGAIVCGWSLGALRALKAAQAALPARLIVVGATPRFLQALDWPHAQPPELLKSFADAVAADPAAALRRFAAVINQGDAHARALTRQMSALVAEPDTPRLLAGLDELRDTDLRKSVIAVRQPVLVVHGEDDPLMPLAAGRWLAEHLPSARIEVFAECAHAPFLSRPDRFIELLRDFAYG